MEERRRHRRIDRKGGGAAHRTDARGTKEALQGTELFQMLAVSPHVVPVLSHWLFPEPLFQVRTLVRTVYGLNATSADSAKMIRVSAFVVFTGWPGGDLTVSSGQLG